MLSILFNRVLIPRLLGSTPDEAAIAAAVPRARLCLSEIDRLMEDHRFLTGAHISLADLMVIPLLYYFGNVPEGRAPMAEHPKLQNWVKQMETRQSFQVSQASSVLTWPYTPRQITLRSAWRFSTVTARTARSSAAGRAAGSSTRSP